MATDTAHDSPWKTSPVIFTIAVFTGLVLHFLIPIPNGMTFIYPALRIAAGSLLFVTGITFLILSEKGLTSAGQPIAPGLPTTRIVDNGVHRYSRNPMYLGGLLMLPGLGIATGITWWLVLTIPTFYAVRNILVLPEERYLAEKFGEEYRQYKSRVRRWL